MSLAASAHRTPPAGALRQRAFASLAAALLAGCASVPLATPGADAQAKQLQPPEGKALLFVFRDDGLAAMSLFPLFVDEERVGDLSNGSYYVVEVEPGPHRLDFPFNDGATTLRLQVEANHRYFVRQSIDMTWALLVTIRRAQLALVDEATGLQALGSLVSVVRLQPHAAEDRLAREARPSPDRALVYVFRWPWAAPGTDFELEVGGRAAGRLAVRAFVVAEVAPGEVEVHAKGANEATLPLRLPPGGVAYVAVAPRVGWTTPRVELSQVDEARARASLAELRLAARLGP
jgi:hypothetical protein